MSLNATSRALLLGAGFILCAALTCGPALGADAMSRYALSDVRCVVVGLRMAEATVPGQRAAGVMLAIYYLGRLDGRAADVELEGLIEREAETMTAAQFRSNAIRCGKAITLKGQEIREIGADLSRKARGRAAPK